MPSIPYNLGIPLATNSPSVDQPNMLTNTNAVDTWNSVDHYSFSNSSAGDHKQITFAGNNVPSVTTAPPVLFTNTQDGAGNNLPSSLAQLFFYSGTAVQGKNQFLSTSNGSTFLLGGIILKWGVVNFTGSSKSVAFSNAFPNNIFSVVLSSDTTAPSVNGIISFSSLAVGGFTAYQNGSSALTAYYVAIGN